MEIGAAEYREAALANLEAARIAHEKGLFTVSHYLAGLSVECLLRSYRWAIDSSWNGRHYLPQLLRESGFRAVVSVELAQEFSKQFLEVSSRWSNQHRYTSAGKLTQHLNGIGASFNRRGDKLKENSGVMIGAAAFIVNYGARKWSLRSKK